MKKIKKFVFIFLLLAGNFILTSCFILDKFQESKEREIISLKAKIVPLTFTVVQKENSFEVVYSFLDISGNVVKENSATIRGNELFIDCIVKDFNADIKVAFPVVFYSNAVPSSEGIVIVNEYNNEGFPEIFRGVTAHEVKKFKKLYVEVLNEAQDRNAFRSSPHVVASKKPETYQLVSRIRGGLEILKADKRKENTK